MKFLKSFLFAVIALAASVNVAYSQTTTAVQTTDNTKTLTVKVKGVGCPTDMKMICTNVEKLEGISSFKSITQGATTTFEAKYNPALITEKEIHAAIEGTAGCTDPDSRPYKVKL